MLQGAAPEMLINIYSTGFQRVASKYRVSVNLGEQEFEDLAEMSEKYRVSLAWLGRQAIADFIEKHKKEKLELPTVTSLTNSKE